MSNVFASGMNVNVSIHSPAENNASPIQITVLPPKDGTPGYTPEKGKDYFTPSDKEEIVKEVINALPEGGGSGGVSSWNDLTDRPFKKEFVKLFEKKEVTFDYLEELGGMGIAHVTSEVTAFKFDTRYKVIFNGVEYYNKTVNKFWGTPYPTIGNPLIDGGEDNGQPYMFMASPEEMIPGYGVGLYCIALQTLEKCEIEIYEEIITPFDAAYMPESYVLDITHSDNGNEHVFSTTTELPQTFNLDKDTLYEFYKNTKRGAVRIKLNCGEGTSGAFQTYLAAAQYCYEKDYTGEVVYKVPIYLSIKKDQCIEFMLSVNIGAGLLRFTKMV